MAKNTEKTAGLDWTTRTGNYVDTLYDALWITGYKGIMPGTESSDGYSDQNCKLHKDSCIETQTFCRIMRGNVGAVSVTPVLL
jgi:hypothetical protein